jgi:hypothetical protein
MSKVITLFGSSRPREDHPDYVLARTTGRLLAEAGFAVCNGGYLGTMEAGARGAREAGGHTIGVTLAHLSSPPNAYIREEIRAASLWDRLRILMERGDAYVVFRGSTGTLLELAAVWEAVNKGMMREKPILILGPFWRSTVETVLAELREEGRSSGVRCVHVVDNPEACVRELQKHFSAQ